MKPPTSKLTNWRWKYPDSRKCFSRTTTNSPSRLKNTIKFCISNKTSSNLASRSSWGCKEKLRSSKVWMYGCASKKSATTCWSSTFSRYSGTWAGSYVCMKRSPVIWARVGAGLNLENSRENPQPNLGSNPITKQLILVCVQISLIHISTDEITYHINLQIFLTYYKIVLYQTTQTYLIILITLNINKV